MSSSPGSIELSVAAKVGEKTARRALAEFAREGWTVPKRHVGSVVVERGLPTLFMKRILEIAAYLRGGAVPSRLVLGFSERGRNSVCAR